MAWVVMPTISTSGVNAELTIPALFFAAALSGNGRSEAEGSQGLSII